MGAATTTYGGSRCPNWCPGKASMVWPAVWETVTLAAAADKDTSSGRAKFTVAAEGMGSIIIAAREKDDLKR